MAGEGSDGSSKHPLSTVADAVLTDASVEVRGQSRQGAVKAMTDRIVLAMGVKFGRDADRDAVEAAQQAVRDAIAAGSGSGDVAGLRAIAARQAARLRQSTARDLKEHKQKLREALFGALNQRKVPRQGAGAARAEREKRQRHAAHRVTSSSSASLVQRTLVTCSKCRNTDQGKFTTDGWNADLVCMACGHVVRAAQMADRDWARIQRSDKGELMSSMGDAPSKRYSDSHNLGTVITGGKDVSTKLLKQLVETSAFVAEKQHSVAVGRGDATGRTRDSYKDRRKHKAFERLENVADKLGLNSGVCERSKDYFAAMRDARENLHDEDKVIAASLVCAFEDAVMGKDSQRAAFASIAAEGARPAPEAAEQGAFDVAALLGDDSEEEEGSGPPVPPAAAAGGTLTAVPTSQRGVLQSHLAQAADAVRQAHAAEQAARVNLTAQTAAARASAALKSDSGVTTAAGGGLAQQKLEAAEARLQAAQDAVSRAQQAHDQAEAALDTFTAQAEREDMAREDAFMRDVVMPAWAAARERQLRAARVSRRLNKPKFMRIGRPAKKPRR